MARRSTTPSPASVMASPADVVTPSALKKKNEKAVSPLVHVATALLAFMAGFVNVIGLGLFSKTIGNVTGLVTKLGADLADGMTEGFLVAQFCSFLLGSVLCGVLISGRRAGVGTELCETKSRASTTTAISRRAPHLPSAQTASCSCSSAL